MTAKDVATADSGADKVSPNDVSVKVPVRTAKNASLFYRFCRLIFIFIMTHYFLWIMAPVVIFALAIYYQLYVIVSLMVIAFIAYLPSFLNKDPFITGRPWPALRQWWAWELAQSHVGMECIRTHELDSKKQYIFALHPHGILVLSRINAYGGVWERLFGNIPFRVLGATPMFLIPGSRELCLWMGAVDAGRKTADRVLNSGISLHVYPGGSAELLTTDGGSKVTKLVMRKGFIKLALRHGVSIVPTFVFGEKWLYEKIHVPESIRIFFLKKLRTPLLLFWGKYFTWIPLRLSEDDKRRFGCVYGEPIEVTKSENPTQDEVDAVAKVFEERLVGLFEKYKAHFGYDEDESLELIRK